MLGAIFSFRGRIGRLRYFLSIMAAGFVFGVVLIAALAVWLGPALARYGAHDPQAFASLGPSLVPVAVIVLLGSCSYLWVALSLQARRLRDIGWDPALVLPAWLIGDVVLRVAALEAGRMASSVSAVATLVDLALTCCLLFMPGKDIDPESPAKVLDAPARTAGPAAPGVRAKPVAPKVTWAPAANARAAWAPAPGQSGFGRRNL